MLHINELPALRIAFPLTAGILFNKLLISDELNWIAVIFLLSVLLGSFTMLIQKRGANRNILFIFVPSLLMPLSFGILLVEANKHLTKRTKFISTELDLHSDSIYTISCTNAGFVEKKRFGQTVMKVNAIYDGENWKQVKGKIQVFFRDTVKYKEIRIKDELILKTTILRPSQSINPYSFDYSRYLANKEIYYIAFVDDKDIVQISKRNWLSVQKIAESIRRSLIHHSYLILGKNELTDLSNGLLLGYSENIDEETIQAFKKSGAMHLLVVSGMHIVLIYSNIMLLLSIPVFRKILKLNQRMFIALLFVWLFSLIVGLEPSILRASILLSIVVLGKVTRSTAHPLNLVLGVYVFMLLFNSNLVFDVGFQLSFAAVIGIITLQEPIFKCLPFWLKTPKMVGDLLAVTISAQITTMPFVIYYFNQFPIYFLLSGVIAVFISDFIVKIGLSTLILSFIWLKLAIYIGFLWKLLLYVLDFCVYQIAQLPFSTVSFIYFNIWMAILSVFAILLIIVNQYYSIRNFSLKLCLIFIIILLIDISHLLANRSISEVRVYSNRKGRILEVQNGYRSTVYHDSIVNHKAIQNIVEKLHIQKSVFDVEYVVLSNFECSQISVSNFNMILPVSQNQVEKFINDSCIVILPPNDRFIVDRCKLKIQFNSIMPNQSNLHNLKDSIFIYKLNL